MKELLILVFCLLLGSSFYAQSTVVGTIIADDGTPLAGATIMVEETGNGTAAKNDGSYELTKLSKGKYTLKVSYVGYATQRISVVVDAQQVYRDITLQSTAISLGMLSVRATRAGVNTPMTYTTLKAEDIEPLNLGQDVPFVLRWTPSAVVTSDAGAGVGYTGIRIRGTDPTRINVTINGIPLNDSESQGVFWVNMPDFASSVSDIQIQRGVGASTNGAGAFGATINLNTSKLNAEPYASFNGSVGSFNTQKANIEFGTGLINDRFTIDGRLSRITSDGFIDRATSDLSSYYLSSAYVGKKSSLRFNLFSGHEVTYQAWYGVPAAFIDDPELRTFNPSGTEKEGEPHEDEVDNYQQTHYQLLYDYQFSPQLALNLSLHYTQGMGYFEQYKSGQSIADYGFAPVEIGDSSILQTDLIRRLWLDNDFFGGVYSLNYQSTDGQLDFILGGGYNIYEGDHFGEVIWAEYASDSEIGDRYYENDARKTDFNIYAKLDYGLTSKLRAYLDLQYRRVGYEFLGINRDFENVREDVQLDFFNPKAGLFYELNDKSNLYASVAIAQREPNRNDYVESTADSRPEPEKLLNGELGYRFQNEKSLLEVNTYYMYYRDQLVLNGEINDVGANTRINVDESYRLGLEIAGGIQVFSPLSIEGNVTLSRNRLRGFSEFVDVYDENFIWLEQELVRHQETDLSFSPSLIAAAGFSLAILPDVDHMDLDFNWMSKYVSKQYIDNTSDENNTINPYSFTDLSLRYVLRSDRLKQVALTFSMQNAFDQTFETNAWSYRYVFDGVTTIDQGFFPQAGRNYLVGLTIGI
jgi:iron complex outermembrane receptor protein